MGNAESETERLMRAYIDAWNDHDTERAVRFLSEDCEQYSREDLRSVCNSWFEGFPDLTHEIEELVVDGDRVLARITLGGTHEGTFQGIPPTGNEISVSDHVSTRFADGLIVEHHATLDTVALRGQLGEPLPAPGTRAENKAVVRRFFEAINDRDRAAFVETMTSDFTYGDIEGPEEMAENDWRWIEAMDITWDIQQMHANEEYVMTRVVASGTHRGEILGLEPTGQSWEATGTMLTRIEDGQIAEWWSDWDFAGILDQIGAIDSAVY